MFVEESARREKRQIFAAAIGLALAVMVLAPPIVEAAAQKVKVVNKPTVKKIQDPVKVANGAAIESRQLGNFGNLQTGPSSQFPAKGIAVRTTAGGGGFFGAGVCGAATNPDEAEDTGDDNRVIVPATSPGQPPNIVTGIIIGSPSPATVTIKAPSLPSGNNPILALRTTAEQPNEFVGLGNGLTVSPSRLVFECPAGAGGSFVVIGQ